MSVREGAFRTRRWRPNGACLTYALAVREVPASARWYANLLAKLKQEGGKDLFVFGSAKLCDGLMQRGLFDEYRICLAPVVLGGGAPLFKPVPEPRRMTLLEARALKTGAIILRYAPGPVGA